MLNNFMEQQLITKAINGCTSSFEQLVHLYENQLMRFLKLQCKTQSDAEDIFQETFLNAHLYLASYNKAYAFSTWLFTIALNQIKRQANKLKLIYSEQMIEVENDSQPPASITVGDMANQNIWFEIRQHLNSEQFQLMWFTYAEEFTGKQVATILERSLAWVKINLVRCKKLLNKKLNQDALQLTASTAEQIE
jgi:RNA polymerase sigma-70 factor, ECF subfamily